MSSGILPAQKQVDISEHERGRKITPGQPRGQITLRPSFALSYAGHKLLWFVELI